MEFRVYDRQLSAVSQEPLTSQQQSGLSATRFAGFTRARLLQHYIAKNGQNLACIKLLLKYIAGHRYKRILSLGAGACVVEHFLSEVLDDDCTVVAADYDEFCLEQARRFFPKLAVARFDLGHDDIKALGPIDLAYFLSSTAFMSEDRFVTVLRELRSIGVGHVIDINAGFVPIHMIPKRLVRTVLKPSGQVIGYCRTRGSLRAIYRRAGYRIVEETKVASSRYTAVLTPDVVTQSVRE